MFRPSPTGVAACATLSLALWTLAAIAFYNMLPADYKYGEKTEESSMSQGICLLLGILGNRSVPEASRRTIRECVGLRCFALFFLDDLVIMTVLGTYFWVILVRFVQADTSLLTRLLFRAVGHPTFNSILLSYSGWLQHRLVEDLGVDQHSATIMYTIWAAFFRSLVGRLLQSSASNVALAVAFETFATVSEIITFDGFLKGVDPIHWVCLTLGLRKVGDIPSRRDENQTIFCSDAIIIMSMSEAAALVVATAEGITEKSGGVVVCKFGDSVVWGAGGYGRRRCVALVEIQGENERVKRERVTCERVVEIPTPTVHG